MEIRVRAPREDTRADGPKARRPELFINRAGSRRGVRVTNKTGESLACLRVFRAGSA